MPSSSSTSPSQSLRSVELNDWRWISDTAGRAAIAQIVEQLQSLNSPLQILTQLRRQWTAERASLALSQANLVIKARAKFSRAEEMMFTENGLAQATDERIATYKAARVGGARVVDLCCGIGGDLLAFSRRGEAVGVEMDAKTAICAKHNCLTVGGPKVSIIEDIAENFAIVPGDVVHIDPDRRGANRRTVDPRYFSPDLAVIDRLIRGPNATVVKIAPATQIDQSWRGRCELEWIGHRRECKQQLLWSGELAPHPGQHVATVISHDGEHVESIVGRADDETSLPVGPLQKYLMEPHASVLAAGLAASLAQRHSACRFSPDVAYLTADRPVSTLLASCFEILAVVSMRRSAIIDAGRTLRGRIEETKTRGLSDINLAAFENWPTDGEQPLTLVLTRVASEPTALICQRVVHDSA